MLFQKAVAKSDSSDDDDDDDDSTVQAFYLGEKNLEGVGVSVRIGIRSHPLLIKWSKFRAEEVGGGKQH